MSQVLSPAEIAGYARGAGFSGDALVTAVAVALAESSGRVSVVNSIGCVGLWQINQPVHVKAHPTWTRAWLQNPANNAQAAYALSNGGKNWLPWEAYTNGSYRMFLGSARKAAGSAGTGTGSPNAVPVATSPAAGLAGLLSLGSALTDASTWARVAYFTMGAVMILWALMKMMGDNKLSGTAKAVVATAVTRKPVK